MIIVSLVQHTQTRVWWYMAHLEPAQRRRLGAIASTFESLFHYWRLWSVSCAFLGSNRIPNELMIRIQLGSAKQDYILQYKICSSCTNISKSDCIRISIEKYVHKIFIYSITSKQWQLQLGKVASNFEAAACARGSLLAGQPPWCPLTAVNDPCVYVLSFPC